MDTCFIATKASLKRKNVEREFSVTLHESYKPKAKSQHKETLNETENIKEIKDTTPEINMKRAKQEIIKFGMTGFDAATQEEAKIKHAIKLGAKPHKNKYKNYKLLLEEKKKEKLQNQKIVQFQQLGKNNAGRSTAKGKTFDKKRKLKGKHDILDIYGIVKSKELKSFHKEKQNVKSRKK